MDNANGEAQVAFKKHFRGIAEKYGLDPDAVNIRTMPARITSKLVRVSVDWCFDRATGEDRSAFRHNGKGKSLVAYRRAGEEKWTTI